MAAGARPSLPYRLNRVFNLVEGLSRPTRPLLGGMDWVWRVPFARIYHRDQRTPVATHRRIWGPLYRFDHHEPSNPPAEDSSGRSVLYLALALQTSGAEVFGDIGVARICPSFRAAWLVPRNAASLQDLRGTGAMLIGATPSIGSAEVTRELTQEWARAIYEDRPAGSSVCGVRYAGAHEEGDCLCIWDTSPPVDVVHSDAGIEDRALLDAAVFSRFLVAMDAIKLAVERLSHADCERCTEYGGF